METSLNNQIDEPNNKNNDMNCNEQSLEELDQK